MLTNNELQTISKANVMLLYLKQFATSDDSFYEDTGISIKDIDIVEKELNHIHNKYALKKIQASEQANAWNKAHPEQHRKHNRDYAKRKKEVK